MVVKNKLLLTGSLLIFLVSLLHIYIAYIGGDLYLYFGAGEEYYQLDISGSLKPMIHTLILAILFLCCACYGLSGSKSFDWLPWKKPVLYTIAGIFLLRGLVVFYELFRQIQHFNPDTLRFTFFSLYAAVTGILYLLGTQNLSQHETI